MYRASLLSPATRSGVWATIALGLFVLGSSAAWSQAASSPAEPTPAPSADEPIQRTVVPLGTTGFKVAIDPETGRLVKPTPEQARGLALGLQQMLSRSTDGLQPVFRGNGMVTLDLQGRFMSVAVVRLGADGRLEADCVAGQEAAEAFLLGAPAPGAADTDTSAGKEE